MNSLKWLLASGLALILAGCAGGGAGIDTTAAPTLFEITAQSGTVMPDSGTVDPSTPLSATLIPPLPDGSSTTALKYRLLAEFPDFFFCDPDYYPVARADEMDLARERFPDLQANTEEFAAILAHHNLTNQTDFTDEQILLIYQDHKKLAAIPFELTDAGYRFQIQVAKAEGDGELFSGIIDGRGVITIEQRQQIIATCPICLAVGTLIDAPDGAIRVEELRVGMLIWTLDSAGQRIAQPVIEVGKTMIPASHQVIHLFLSDGRDLHVSAGHPTADGRTIGDLHAGDLLDGALVLSADRIPYHGAATYDLLPAGETGFYFANGILIGSTLHP